MNRKSWIGTSKSRSTDSIHVSLFTPNASRPHWSGRWDLNPRQPAWKAGTLPLSYARMIQRHASNAEPWFTTDVSAAQASAFTTKNLPAFGGQARIRTLEADGNRFTVC